MIPIDSQNLESYVPVYDAIPDEWQDARAFVVEQFKKLANAVNLREIGFYLDQELLSGKAFIPGINETLDQGNSQQFRTVLRKVIDFGTLPNATTKSVLHEIIVDYNFTLVFMGAYATDPVGLISFPIPYADPNTLANAVSLTMDDDNVNITTGSNRSNYTRCFVTIEYMQEL